jgi:hypothetical protein
MSNQEKRQQSVRAVTGTAYAYNDDWMALFTAAGITTGVYNERLLVWINTQLGSAYTTLPDAMKAFAVRQERASWDEMGTFSTGLSLNFLSGTLDSRITFSRASHATMFDSTGKLTYAPNNLFLNSATLSTQGVTTAAINYIISFKGTGTITLTGTSTAGPIVGTGVADRVFLKITPTAGTLTCTVSGSVTEAQIEAVTYETSPRTYNATTAAAYYGPRFDYNPATLAARGLLIEEARTNSCIRSQQLSNAAWGSKAYVTDNFAVAPDGTTTAARINNTGVIDNVAQVISVSPSSPYTFSFFSKNNGGTTAQYRVYDLTNGADIVASTGYFSQINGSTWTRVSLPFTTPAGCTQAIVYTSASNGPTENVLIWGTQLEAGDFTTSYIPTVAASVSRAADTASLAGANFSSWWNASAGSFVVGFELQNHVGVNSRGVLLTLTGASGLLLYMNLGKARTFNGATFLEANGTYSENTSKKAGLSFDAAGGSICFDATAVVSDANLVFTGTATALVIDGGTVAGGLNGWLASITYYNARLPNATLQSLTA